MSEKLPLQYVFSLPRRLSGERADMAILDLLGKARKKDSSVPALSRAQLGHLFDQGLVRVEGKGIQAGERLPLGSCLEVVFPSEEAMPSLASFAHLRPELILETEHFYAFHKPAGLTMHRFLGMRPKPTLADFALALDPKLQGVGESPERPGLVHRLDKETSGIVLVAKTQEAYDELKSLFQERRIQKSYLGLSFGIFSQEEGIIDLSLVRHTGSAKRMIFREKRIKEGQTVREAVTHYKVLKAFENASLVLLQPKTGRTHQLRAHLLAVQHPLLGDRLYFSQDSRATYPDIPRQMLHAWRLDFELFGSRYQLEAPLPADFEEALQDIDGSPNTRYDNGALKSLFPDHIG